MERAWETRLVYLCVGKKGLSEGVWKCAKVGGKLTQKWYAQGERVRQKGHIMACRG